ncbi:hypothetical protein GEMMAAP_03660 [Gemmatimonas phototrophica]|uniref:Uncharacterized protein n=1 Tax=Gemmatimonas phototrophica TaxID=1379270 RepID=A0A143BHT9_9BACT|nr:hypothetical protein GEMMAAP_03660 [Gemmatimonas phototrophica]
MPLVMLAVAGVTLVMMGARPLCAWQALSASAAKIVVSLRPVLMLGLACFELLIARTAPLRRTGRPDEDWPRQGQAAYCCGEFNLFSI